MTDSHSRSLRTVLTALVALSLGAIVLERLAYAGAWRNAFDPAEAVRQLLYAAPSLCYCGALWHLRQAAGRPGWTALARRLQHVGVLLAAGALLGLLAVPVLRGWLGDAEPRTIDLDVASLILAGIGLALTALARHFERAAAIQADLDGMF